MDNDDAVPNGKLADALIAVNRKSTGADELSAVAGATAKLPYQKPQLHVYGAVHKITGGLAGSGTDAQGMYMDMTMSDCNAKQDVVRIGTHPDGFGLYLFNYKPGYRQHVDSITVCNSARTQQPGTGFRHFGVMAQEIQQLVPMAVTSDAGGLLQVDYHRLGIRLPPLPSGYAARGHFPRAV
jgi:hypothetical protein